MNSKLENFITEAADKARGLISDLEFLEPVIVLNSGNLTGLPLNILKANVFMDHDVIPKEVNDWITEGKDVFEQVYYLSNSGEYVVSLIGYVHKKHGFDPVIGECLEVNDIKQSAETGRVLVNYDKKFHTDRLGVIENEEVNFSVPFLMTVPYDSLETSEDHLLTSDYVPQSVSFNLREIFRNMPENKGSKVLLTY